MATEYIEKLRAEGWGMIARCPTCNRPQVKTHGARNPDGTFTEFDGCDRNHWVPAGSVEPAPPYTHLVYRAPEAHDPARPFTGSVLDDDGDSQ